MKTLITFFSVVVLLASLGGCKENVAWKCANPDDPACDIKVYYDLPAGWEWLDEDSRIAVTYQAKGDTPNFVKLSPSGFPEGNDDDAKDTIQNYHEKALLAWEYRMADPDSEREPQPEYVEIVVEGTTIYIEMHTTYYGGTIWSSVFSFVKGERVATFTMLDRADLYQSEIATIIQSLKWER